MKSIKDGNQDHNSVASILPLLFIDKLLKHFMFRHSKILFIDCCYYYRWQHKKFNVYKIYYKLHNTLIEEFHINFY